MPCKHGLNCQNMHCPTIRDDYRSLALRLDVFDEALSDINNPIEHLMSAGVFQMFDEAKKALENALNEISLEIEEKLL